MTLREIAADPVMMEIGRKAVEDALVDLRNSGIFVLRNNGCVIRNKDGKDSHIIRLGPEQAVRIALDAIATHLGEPKP